MMSSRAASRAWNFGPTNGISAKLQVPRNATSNPGSTMWTQLVFRFRLGPFGSELGNQFVRPSIYGERNAGGFANAGTDPRGRRGERFVRVIGLGARQIEIPLVDAGPFDDRRERMELGPNLRALLAARFERNRNTHGVGAKAQRLRDGHGGANTERAGFVRSGAHDPVNFARPADDQQRRYARAFRIDRAGDRDEKRVCIGQEYPAHESPKKT